MIPLLLIFLAQLFPFPGNPPASSPTPTLISAGHACAASADGGSTVTTSSLNTTGATFLVATVNSTDSNPSISDSKSNTWTRLTVYHPGNYLALFYAANPTVGSGHTFSKSSGGGFPALCVAAFSGVATTSPFDSGTDNGLGTPNGANPQLTGSITPNAGGELLVSSFTGNNGGGPVSVDSGFTIIDQQNQVGGQSFGPSGLAYLVQGSPAAVNLGWTITTVTGSRGANIVAFKHQ